MSRAWNPLFLGNRNKRQHHANNFLLAIACCQSPYQVRGCDSSPRRACRVPRGKYGMTSA